MSFNIQKRIQLLKDSKNQFDNNTILFDPNNDNFGFKKFDQLFPVVGDQIKGYPCIAYNKFSDTLKFGVKVIPLENNFDKESHPSHIELLMLEEFSKLVDSYVTPHITYFFKKFTCQNNKKALVPFPLKAIRKSVYNECNILVSEYVTGGSVEEWIQEQVNISEKQWKTIIFTIAWTLLVLGDKYNFIHNDFHYGNILIDTCINPSTNNLSVYTLTRKDGSDLSWYVPNSGIVAKIWDLEYSCTFKDSDTLPKKKNDFFKNEENVPHEYNPYYDLHSFLTSLLELNIPVKLEEFIRRVYPIQVIPPITKKFDKSAADDESSHYTGSNCCTNSDCTCSDYSDINSENYKHYHWNVDEKMDDYDERNDENVDVGTRNDEKSSDTYEETVSEGSEESEVQLRTEFLLGDRLLNGTEKKIKLPTPLDILSDEYFSIFTKKYKFNSKVEFKYKMEA